MNERRGIAVMPTGELRLGAREQPDLIGHLFERTAALPMLIEHDAQIKELQRRGA